MSILVYIESDESGVKKSSQEAISYAHELSTNAGFGEVVAIHFGSSEGLEKAGNYGASKVLNVSESQILPQQDRVYCEVLTQALEKENGDLVVLPKSPFIDVVAGRLAVRINASLASSVVGLPNVSDGFEIKRSIFSGKAFTKVKLTQPKKILSINKNIINIKEIDNDVSIEDFKPSIDESFLTQRSLEVKKVSGGIPLTEADLVVSAGRGLKGPENWGMIEELADVLGAATACSKPVSDAEWRPHHEHVGQTGLKVSPTLYIAVGISGAIQHLAGVNSSKVIVVINKDSEAPFFKAADYGIVGDAFEVIPRLIEVLKEKK